MKEGRCADSALYTSTMRCHSAAVLALTYCYNSLSKDTSEVKLRGAT